MPITYEEFLPYTRMIASVALWQGWTDEERVGMERVIDLAGFLHGLGVSISAESLAAFLADHQGGSDGR